MSKASKSMPKRVTPPPSVKAPARARKSPAPRPSANSVWVEPGYDLTQPTWSEAVEA